VLVRLPSPQFVLLQSASKRADKLRAKGHEVDKPAFAEMLRLEPDGGVTNFRKTDSKHWTRWLTPANRCLVREDLSQQGHAGDPDDRDERDLWLSGAPWDEVKRFQRPRPDGVLKIAGIGGKQDDLAEI
jgi:putative SOS response-associated peptidase YedK